MCTYMCKGMEQVQPKTCCGNFTKTLDMSGFRQDGREGASQPQTLGQSPALQAEAVSHAMACT